MPDITERIDSDLVFEETRLRLKGSFPFKVVLTENDSSDFDTWTVVGSRIIQDTRHHARKASDMIDSHGNMTAYFGDLLNLVLNITSDAGFTGIDVKVEGKLTAQDPGLILLGSETLTSVGQNIAFHKLDLQGCHYIRISWKYTNAFDAGTNNVDRIIMSARIFEDPGSLPQYAFAGDTPTAASTGFTSVATSIGSADLTPPTGGAIATDAFLVTDYSEVVVRVVPTDPAATWDFQVYQSNTGDNDMDKVRLTADTGQQDRTRFIVNTKGADYLYLAISNISGGDVTVQMVPISPN